MLVSGRGVFTTVKRNHGEFLLHYTGERIAKKEGNRREKLYIEQKEAVYLYFLGDVW
jgi:SET domain-containing protein